MNSNETKTRPAADKQADREESKARRMRRRHQNHSYFGTTSAPTIFTLRW